MTIEGLRLYIRKQIIKYTCNSRRKKLKNKNFTIISNNCWGGMVYESFNLPKQSPTVGLFFMADEYIKFLQSFPDILNEGIEFIDPMESKYVDFLKQDSRFGQYPIGKLGGIEIEFLHYHSKEEVLEKWKRRCERINLDHLIVKMNDQNLCNVEHIKEFSELPFKNKIFFSAKPYEIPGTIFIESAKSQEFVFASQEPVLFKRYFDVMDTINNC